MNADQRALYEEVILEHNRHPRITPRIRAAARTMRMASIHCAATKSGST